MGVVDNVKNKLCFKPVENDAATQMKPVAQPVVQQPEVSTPVTNYTDMVNRLMPQQTQQQIDAENKRMRARKNIAMLGDTLNAVANLGTAMAGAPTGIDHRNALSAVSKQRWDELKAERERNKQQYYNAMLRAAQLDDANRQNERTYQLQKEYYNTRNEKLMSDAEANTRRAAVAEFNASTNAWYKNATIEQKEAALEIQRELAAGRISLMEANARLANVKAATGGFAPQRPVQEKTTTVVEEKDPVSGKKTRTTTVRGGKPAKKKINY